MTLLSALTVAINRAFNAIEGLAWKLGHDWDVPAQTPEGWDAQTSAVGESAESPEPVEVTPGSGQPSSDEWAINDGVVMVPASFLNSLPPGPPPDVALAEDDVHRAVDAQLAGRLLLLADELHEYAANLIPDTK
ncbi:hypothetical protein ACAG26_24175 [Mycobacterium sp. pUA109]|uniref:hypothetical protein n=1 Tax=Mycobacterium sp. pUA109 TaxID=3238982 RepID=UPI00351AD7CC